ncbi:MAG: sialidase family protein [Eubacteriales bacterium]
MFVNANREHGAVSRGGNRLFGYHGWPSICADEHGVLYAVCSGGRVAHICPFGKTWLFKSFDEGKTWSCPIVVNDTELDDRDAGIICLGGEKMLVTWFVHPAHVYLTRYRDSILGANCGEAEKSVLKAQLDYIERYDRKRELAGSFVRVSNDGGLTWGETVRVPVSAPHGPIRLSDGSLFYVGTDMYSDELPENVIAAYKSCDDGATWSKVSEIDQARRSAGTGYYEPHAVELPGGRILVAIRAETEIWKERFTVVTCFSDDGGMTWSPLKDTGICGSPPHLLLHSSGALICSVGRRKPPFGERAYVSFDGGESWEDEYVLRDDAEGGDLGYPCTAELSDGSLFTVYYQQHSPEDGKNRSLLWTKWKLK